MARAVLAKKSTTRQTLIEAAHALIWANSYAHVSVEEICRAAGVQKGSFYHFFPTKIDLAAAAMEDHWQTASGRIDAIFASCKTPPAQLRGICQEILRKQKESFEATGKVCGCPYATMGTEMSGNNEQLRSLSEKTTKRFLGYYELLLQNAVTAKLIPARALKQRAKEMHTYSIGAMMQARITNRLDSVGKSLETALFRLSGFDAAGQKPSSRDLPSAQVSVRLVRKR